MDEQSERAAIKLRVGAPFKCLLTAVRPLIKNGAVGACP
jgi:hypothetical protein